MLFHEISRKKNSPAIPNLIKILLHLEIPHDNVNAIKELLNQVEITMEEVSMCVGLNCPFLIHEFKQT